MIPICCNNESNGDTIAESSHTPPNPTPNINSNPNHNLNRILFPIPKLIKLIIMINRYPSSVRIGYIEYQAYDSLQGLCSYLRGVVTTAAVLRAAGVGDVNADAAGAAMASQCI